MNNLQFDFKILYSFSIIILIISYFLRKIHNIIEIQNSKIKEFVCREEIYDKFREQDIKNNREIKTLYDYFIQFSGEFRQYNRSGSSDAVKNNISDKDIIQILKEYDLLSSSFNLIDKRLKYNTLLEILDNENQKKRFIKYMNNCVDQSNVYIKIDEEFKIILIFKEKDLILFEEKELNKYKKDCFNLKFIDYNDGDLGLILD
jgi:hypothetical protein